MDLGNLLGAPLVSLGFGGAAGLVVGYAAKKVTKAVALLLGLLFIACGCGTALVWLVLRHRHRTVEPAPLPRDRDFNRPSDLPLAKPFVSRPTTWLAVRGRNLHAVQNAFGLRHAKPCTWLEGLACEQKLFIAPPVKGWILIVGTSLPDPGDDVDKCFHFLLRLSRRLGEVQFFFANRVLGHHAWVRAEAGRVVRAYAWNGETLWNQGIKTRAETDLGVKCFQYLETPDRATPGAQDLVGATTEKVPELAGRWSLDPETIDGRVLENAFGIAAA